MAGNHLHFGDIWTKNEKCRSLMYSWICIYLIYYDTFKPVHTCLQTSASNFNSSQASSPGQQWNYYPITPCPCVAVSILVLFFQLFCNIDPNLFNVKVIPVRGDLCLENLGICKNALSKMEREVRPSRKTWKSDLVYIWLEFLNGCDLTQYWYIFLLTNSQNVQLNRFDTRIL